MSDLWAYGRRHSCYVRYRHGGYSALYPVQEREVVNTVAKAVAGGGTTAVEAPLADKHPENNVLAFPSARQRERIRRKPGGRGQARFDPKKPRD